MKSVKLYLNYAGYCWAKENDAIRGGRKQKIKFHALWGLIHHPEKGYILYDTGYTERFHEVTKRFPNKIYALATQVEIKPEEEIVHQLSSHGISPEEIEHVIITHFHADHVAGLKDFPNAKFYTSRKALEHTVKLPRSISFSKGVLKDLLPSDLVSRTILIDEACEEKEDEIFGIKYDLFNDNSLHIYHLPGHAAGQIGVLLKTNNNQYFLVADSCWIDKSYKENILPNSIVRLFFHSWKDFQSSLSKLNSFHKKNPDIIIVPTHCSNTTDSLVRSKIDLDVL